MANTEEKIVKIIDESVHTRGASVIQDGSYGALAVKNIESAPTDVSQKNASYSLSNTNDIVDSTTYLTKTIDGAIYRRTLTYNSDGDLLGVTSWEEVA